MDSIKTIIIDDEKLARDIIKNYLNEHDQFELVDECSNGFDGVKSINEKKPDLVFLDIQMPKLSGFEMLELLDEVPLIVFTTAYDQYAIKAFEINAVDYLLKPFSYDRFDEAVSRALEKINNKGSKAEIEKLLEHKDETEEYIDRVIIKFNQKVIIIPVEDIDFIQAQDDYVEIHSEQGSFLKQKTMKYFEAHLSPKEFVRIHRSFIVRIDHIKQIEVLGKESYILITNKNKKLSVSKSGYAKLKEVLD